MTYQTTILGRVANIYGQKQYTKYAQKFSTQNSENICPQTQNLKKHGNYILNILMPQKILGKKIFSKGKSNIERQISKKDLNWSLKQIWAKTCKLIKINCNIQTIIL